MLPIGDADFRHLVVMEELYELAVGDRSNALADGEEILNRDQGENGRDPISQVKEILPVHARTVTGPHIANAW